MSPRMELIQNKRNPGVKVSVVLLDWGVRESFHSLTYLNRQTLPRTDYELIWIEFYDHKPQKLLHLVESAEPSTPVLDKWLVMAYPDNVRYHKHRMYNAGIVLAEGRVCVFCDSDAIFSPTFMENILEAFASDANRVVHLDEVRNYSKKFYPFNYPTITEVLGKGCVNWHGQASTGLDNSKDMLHEANYGACMAAWRRDLIEIGGADEHRDYLGYICGPYEMTFRLVNHGRTEHWLRHEYIYHVWHPNTSGFNVEVKGPDDGRGISLLALQMRATGKVAPALENSLFRLAAADSTPADTKLAMLCSGDDSAWIGSEESGSATVTFQPGWTSTTGSEELVEEGYLGFNILRYRGVWYGLHQGEGEFEPEKVKMGAYTRLYCGESQESVRQIIRQRRTWRRKVKDIGKMVLQHLGMS